VADVARLPHADASVDLVVSSISLHHWDDPGAGLREVARVLRPGGRAWIYDVRAALRRAAQRADGDPGTMRLESRLPGAGRLNPLGRLRIASSHELVTDE
jgi:ubiquinone/menaquinone biosynthesis C-methylase UbiE